MSNLTFPTCILSHILMRLLYTRHFVNPALRYSCRSFPVVSYYALQLCLSPAAAAADVRLHAGGYSSHYASDTSLSFNSLDKIHSRRTTHLPHVWITLLKLAADRFKCATAQIQIQIQMGICRARLTNCPGALTNVRMLCETGEL